MKKSNKYNNNFLIVILGPTATGKSKVAVELASLINGEIISADSMAVYKLMDIGTAKPTEEEKRKAVHHLIDVVLPDQDFSVAHFQDLARGTIESIHKRKKLPIMVGGTGLFIHAVIDGFQFGDVGIDNDLRNRLKKFAEKHGNEALHNRLKEVDPHVASRLHPNDQKRIIRALEVFEKTGEPMSSRIERDENNYNASMYGLYLPREELYDKINKRVDKMIKDGLVKEVKMLLERGYHSELVSMQGLGYKEVVSYLKGEIEFEEAVYLIKRNTRRFAKRQLTWFRRDKRVKWLNINEYNDAAEIAAKIAGETEGVKDYVSNQCF